MADTSLAESYAGAQNDEKVKTFWHTTISPKKLHHRIIDLEKKMGLDGAAINDLVQSRRSMYENQAQSSHLSYVAAISAIRAPLINGSEEDYRLAIFGVPGDGLLDTVKNASFATWYFACMGFQFLMGERDGEAMLTADMSNHLHRRIVIGRDVLVSIVLDQSEIDQREVR